MLKPVTLEGTAVRLEPMRADHHPALCEAGANPEIFRWFTTQPIGADGMRAFVATALDWQTAGTALPFVTVERGSDRVVGSTRFANYDAEHRRVEIGWTWIAPAWQRTRVNTEAKFLMLRHAFETLELRRVELKTDANNARSRAAILRLGAVQEGTLRSRWLTSTGHWRDDVYFSILAPEWSTVKAGLERRLAA